MGIEDSRIGLTLREKRCECLFIQARTKILSSEDNSLLRVAGKPICRARSEVGRWADFEGTRLGLKRKLQLLWAKFEDKRSSQSWIMMEQKIWLWLHWYQRVTVPGVNETNIRILNMKNYGVFLAYLLENGSDEAVNDTLLSNSNVEF